MTDRSDASSGGTGAPPPPDAQNRASTDLRRADAAPAVLGPPSKRSKCSAPVGQRSTASREQAPSPLRATVVRNGPLLLRGEVEIFDDAGQFLRRDMRVAICRCGRSRHMPFCDNSHRAKIRVEND